MISKQMKGNFEYTKVDFDEKKANDGHPIVVGAGDGLDYQLEVCLGHGFEGEVWKVKEGKNRFRALKFEIGDIDIGQHLKQEYETLSQLNHPSIVKALKYWSGPTLGSPKSEDEEDFHWPRGHMLTELIDGSPLDFSKLDKKTSRKILLDLVSVLKYLNITMKLSHGDLNGNNILITQPDYFPSLSQSSCFPSLSQSSYFPVLVDFGFCGPIEQSPTSDRQYLGLLYLAFLGLNSDQIHQFKTNLSWYSYVDHSIPLDKITEAIRFSGLTTHQIADLSDFLNGKDYDHLSNIIKNGDENEKFDVETLCSTVLLKQSTQMTDTTEKVSTPEEEKKVKHDQSYALMTKNLAEIIDPEKQIQSILGANQQVKIYWGTATTGKPHLGYLVPLIKLRDFLLAGAHVTILFADIHAILDNLKSTPELIEHRTAFYQFLITRLLSQLFADVKVDMGQLTDQLRFVKGSDFQTGKKYVMDVYKMLALTTYKSAQHAGAEVVKQSKDPLLSSLSYPLLQALDEQYLDVDLQFGGVDQRKIFMYARENLPKLGYKKRAYFMNPLIPGLTKSGKMSSSEPLSKIDFDDSDKTILEKITRAFSVDGQTKGNGLMAILKYILFEFNPEGFLVEREEKYGGNVFYSSFNQLEQDFVAKKIGSVDLKPTIAKLLIKWIRPIREIIKGNDKLVKLAYP